MHQDQLLKSSLFLKHFLFYFTLVILFVTLLNPFGPLGRVQAAESGSSHFILDQKVGLNVRTYPIGFQAFGTVGINQALWGDPSTWKYGYLRGALNGATSAVVNRGGVEFQVFPSSILGLSAGYDWGYRSYTPHYVNCVLLACNGRVDRFFVKANFVAAYSNIIFLMNARYDHLHSFDTAKSAFFDEMTLLTGQSRGERVMTWNPILLYSLSPKVRVGAMSLYSHAIDTGDFSHLYGPIANYSWSNSLSLIGGAGLNRSPVVESALSAFFVLQYTIAPSLSINDLSSRAERSRNFLPNLGK